MKLVVAHDHSIEIIGTLDLVPGRANLNGATRLPDGTLDIDWAGETTMFWDDQKTVQRRIDDGHPLENIYLDEDGNEYLESELELIDGNEPEEDEE